MNIYTTEYLRVKAIDKCLRDRSRKYFIEDLIVACNKAVQEYYPENKIYQKRTIYSDIEKLKEENELEDNIVKSLEVDTNERDENYIHPNDLRKPSTNSRRKEAYSYRDANINLSSNDLNNVELTQIKDALSVMTRIKGRPEYSRLNEIILKLETDLLHDQELPAIMSYDDNEHLVGLEHLDALIEAIREQEAVEISYQLYTEVKPERVIVYPYYLKQYNKRWFLYGNRKDRPDLNYIPIFSIDRIKKVIPCHPEKEIFKEPNMKIEEYLKHVIGVSTSFDSIPQTVFLKFHPKRYNYIKTKPIHTTQTCNDSNCIVQIKVIHNKELEQLILSYGADVKVIAPAGLKENLERISKNLFKMYSESANSVLGNN
jgi:predicted DNA-binding transcriptional regulator YafY